MICKYSTLREGCEMITKISFLKIGSFLKTAGIEEAYAKYYADIPKETFNELVLADPTAVKDAAGNPKKIGTYGQWILRMFQIKKLKQEDLYKITRDLKALISLLPTFKKKEISFNINKFESPLAFAEYIRTFKPLIAPDIEEIEEEEYPQILLTEQYFIKMGEAEKAYEDENHVIFVPLTLEASKFYGKGSDWCTLFPDRFKEYSSEDKLWIIVNKEGGYADRWQFHFPSNQYMDFYDSPLAADELDIFYKKNPGIETFFKNIYVNKDTLDSIFKGEEYFTKFISGVREIVEDSSRHHHLSLSQIDNYLSGDYVEYDSNLSAGEILDYIYLSKSNFEKIKTLLLNKNKEELEELELDIEDNEDLKTAILNTDSWEISSAIINAYDDSFSNAESSLIREYITSVLTDHFKVDFSNWYPNETIKISRSFLEKHWRIVASATSESFQAKYWDDLLVEIFGKAPASEIANALEYASNYVTVEDEDYNENLSWRLDDI